MNASASEELSSTAEAMSAQAIQLQDMIGFFRVAGSTAGRGASARKALATGPVPRRRYADEEQVDQGSFTRF
ncbi:MAG TPA: methyl-accepting chemotaxis protein, partial [Chitinolyticbacter sp.]|nr:methyl-accepting chemotaxis protein [Chitinolyticbacter sp.]